MTRFFFPDICVGPDPSNTPQRTIDPDQLELMFVDDGSMDYLLSQVDVFGIYPQFSQTVKHTAESDAMIARMVPMLANRGIKLSVSYPPIAYGGTPNFISGINTPTEMGNLAAANDLAVTGVYGLLESLGATIDWNIMDSPIDRLTLNNANYSAPHVSHHGFTSLTYTAVTAGSAGNNITVAHVQSGNNTSLSVSAATVSVLNDTFSRTVTDGWSSPDTGPAYTLTGTAADFDVAGGFGTMSVPTQGTVRTALNATPASTSRQRARAVFSLDAVPTGAQCGASIVLRTQDINNFYQFQAVVETAGTIKALIHKVVAGTTTLLIGSSALAGLTLAGGTQFHIEAVANGSALTMRIWQDGTSRPSAASVSTTDTTFTSGGAGLRASTFAGATNLPRITSWDSFRVDDAAQDGTAITVNLATDSGGAVTSTATDVVATVNADLDASVLVTAAVVSGHGGDIVTVFAATNLAFGDDGLNLSNEDTATAIVAYISALHAARPDWLFGFTEDIRRPYNGVQGYTSASYPSAQMPDFKDFWEIFWPKIVAAGLNDVFKLVMFDTSPELNAGWRDTSSHQAHADDWYARIMAQQRQIEADGVSFVLNMGQSDNNFPSLDSHNAVGPASEQSYQDHVVQGVRDHGAYRRAYAPDLDRTRDFMFMNFGYYPRVQLPVSNQLSQARTYLMTLAAFDRDNFQELHEGPELLGEMPVPRISALLAA